MKSFTQLREELQQEGALGNVAKGVALAGAVGYGAHLIHKNHEQRKAMDRFVKMVKSRPYPVIRVLHSDGSIHHVQKFRNGYRTLHIEHPKG